MIRLSTHCPSRIRTEAFFCIICYVNVRLSYYFSFTLIGLSDVSQTSDWRWLNVDPLRYEKFAANEPVNDFSRDCVQVYPSGLWDDTHCTIGNNYICSYRGTYQTCVMY